MFSKLSNELVILPIENMIEKVNNISKDPLKAANEEEERLLLEEMDLNEDDEFDEVQLEKFKEKQDNKEKDAKKTQLMETLMIEQTL